MRTPSNGEGSLSGGVTTDLRCHFRDAWETIRRGCRADVGVWWHEALGRDLKPLKCLHPTSSRRSRGKNIPTWASRPTEEPLHPSLALLCPFLLLWDLQICRSEGRTGTYCNQATEGAQEQKIDFSVLALSKFGCYLQEVFIICVEEEADGNHSINLIWRDCILEKHVSGPITQGNWTGDKTSHVWPACEHAGECLSSSKKKGSALCSSTKSCRSSPVFYRSRKVNSNRNVPLQSPIINKLMVLLVVFGWDQSKAESGEKSQAARYPQGSGCCCTLA